MFEDNDEFGVQEYRDDIEYLFDMNRIKVKRLHKHEHTNKRQSNDFLALTQNFNEDNNYLDINLSTDNYSKKELYKLGYDGIGINTFMGIVPYYEELNNGDIIEFIYSYASNIKIGDKFKIQLTDDGMATHGQFCFKKFILTRI